MFAFIGAFVKTFQDAFNALMVNEGGYSFDPHDAGGETMYGVTKKVAVAHGYNGAMKDLPITLALSIAKTSYWDSCNCDALDANVAFQVFDAAFNHGSNQARVWLQQAIGVVPDGVIGPKSIAAINACSWQSVVFSFLAIRLKAYTTYGQWPNFGKGWSARVATNLKLAAKG